MFQVMEKTPRGNDLDLSMEYILGFVSSILVYSLSFCQPPMAYADEMKIKNNNCV